MSLLPSHDCLPLKKAFSNTCLLSISQTNPALAFGLLTQRVFIFYCRAIHLLARCDRSDDPIRAHNKEVSMTSSKTLLWSAALLGFVVGGATVLWPGRAVPETAPITLPIETVADYIHAVIEADREVYTRHVVERMQTKGIVVASENWEEKSTLPLPAQFLLESGRYNGKKGLGMQYRLISLWPINKRNIATNAMESIGLGTIMAQPTRPYTGVTRVADKRYFEAVYADLAVTQACVGCHNAHPDSPKRDFKLNDVMGAIVISIELRQQPTSGVRPDGY